MTTHLPNHQSAEASILGGILMDNRAISEIPALEPDDFFDPKHQVVFTAMRNLEAMLTVIDLVTLEAALRTAGKLDALGGPTFLFELSMHPATVGNAVEYAKLVRGAAAMRHVIAEARQIAELGLQPNMEPGDFLAQAEERMITAVGRRRPAGGAKSMRDVVMDAYKRLGEIEAARARGEKPLLAIPTGIEALDDALDGGYERGVINLVAARPAMGKSSVAVAAADATAAAKIGVHVFSLEDPEGVYAARALARRSKVPANSIMKAQINRDQAGPVTEATGSLRKHENWLLDTRGRLTAREITAEARRHRTKNKTQLVIVDYLQKVSKNPRLANNEHAAISEIMQEFAAAATEDGGRVAWLVLCQLNRDGQDLDDPRPRVNHLRGSGTIEEFSKVIVGLYRGRPYGETPRRGIDYQCRCDAPRFKVTGEWSCSHTPSLEQFEAMAQLNVLKKNMGETGIVHATWHGPTLEIR